MSEVLRYNGHVGSIEYSETDGVLFGEVLGIRSLILYEGNSAKELVTDFQESIDDYLDVCEREGSAPETACMETFKVQLEESPLRRAAIYSENAGVSLSSFIAQAVEEKLVMLDEAAQSVAPAILLDQALKPRQADSSEIQWLSDSVTQGFRRSEIQ